MEPPIPRCHARGGVAQLVRALPCHGRGRGFESRRSRHFFNDLALFGRRGSSALRCCQRSKSMAPNNPVQAVEALFFDVFGTLMDWRNSIAREAEKQLAPLGHKLDWIA